MCFNSCPLWSVASPCLEHDPEKMWDVLLLSVKTGHSNVTVTILGMGQRPIRLSHVHHPCTKTSNLRMRLWNEVSESVADQDYQVKGPQLCQRPTGHHRDKATRAVHPWCWISVTVCREDRGPGKLWFFNLCICGSVFTPVWEMRRHALMLHILCSEL